MKLATVWAFGLARFSPGVFCCVWFVGLASECFVFLWILFFFFPSVHSRSFCRLAVLLIGFAWKARRLFHRLPAWSLHFINFWLIITVFSCHSELHFSYKPLLSMWLCRHNYEIFLESTTDLYFIYLSWTELWKLWKVLCKCYFCFISWNLSQMSWFDFSWISTVRCQDSHPTPLSPQIFFPFDNLRAPNLRWLHDETVSSLLLVWVDYICIPVLRLADMGWAQRRVYLILSTVPNNRGPYPNNILCAIQ